MQICCFELFLPDGVSWFWVSATVSAGLPFGYNNKKSCPSFKKNSSLIFFFFFLPYYTNGSKDAIKKKIIYIYIYNNNKMFGMCLWGLFWRDRCAQRYKFWKEVLILEAFRNAPPPPSRHLKKNPVSIFYPIVIIQIINSFNEIIRIRTTTL